MNLTQWPAAEKPREKLVQRGASALSDAELLALFLRTGLPGKTAVDLGRDLLDQFGSIRGLLDAPTKSLCSTKGIGLAKAAQLQAVLEVARRHMSETLANRDVFDSPEVTRKYLTLALRNYQHEVFMALFLDSQHALIDAVELFKGSIAAAPVYPREVVKVALAKNAAAVIFAHNHPSGVAEPSDADLQITRRLQKALALVDINVLDHMIVGDGDVTSLAERGMM